MASLPHNKKILIITDNLPSQINGVVTTYQNIEPLAIREGYSVEYVHPGQFRYISCPGYNEIKLAGLTFGMLAKRLSAVAPTYVHIATEGPLGCCARLLLSHQERCYTTAYHTKFPEAIKKIVGIPESISWPAIRWFHSKSSTVLTTTASMVKQLQSKGFKNNLKPWTRGVDRQIFSPVVRTVNKKNPTLVCVSRVSLEKNLEQFFNLELDGAKKIMVGDGPLLEHYKKTYPLVHFVGAKRGQELASYYQNADCFVFPSLWDTFGLVQIEAMACGTPVAAFPVQGPLDVINQNVTGVMHNDLARAVTMALDLDPLDVYENSRCWNWENAWQIFKSSLTPLD